MQASFQVEAIWFTRSTSHRRLRGLLHSFIQARAPWHGRLARVLSFRTGGTLVPRGKQTQSNPSPTPRRMRQTGKCAGMFNTSALAGCETNPLRIAHAMRRSIRRGSRGCRRQLPSPSPPSNINARRRHPRRRNMTPQEVLKLVKSKDVQFIDLRFMDFPGLWQHTTVPISELSLDSFEHGFGFDGSSIRGWQAINESDMLLIPVADTAKIDPFMMHTTLQMICDVRDP